MYSVQINNYTVTIEFFPGDGTSSVYVLPFIPQDSGDANFYYTGYNNAVASGSYGFTFVNQNYGISLNINSADVITPGGWFGTDPVDFYTDKGVMDTAIYTAANTNLPTITISGAPAGNVFSISASPYTLVPSVGGGTWVSADPTHLTVNNIPPASLGKGLANAIVLQSVHFNITYSVGANTVSLTGCTVVA